MRWPSPPTLHLPSAMKYQAIRCALAQPSMAFEVNSVPWPETIIAGRPRRATSGRELARDPLALDRRVRDRGQALLGDVVDDVEDPEASTAGALVVHEVDRPARVR